MSLYEALDQFVGAGVLACAGVVGNEMPADTALDGAAFSRFLREQRLGEEFGIVLDALAHEIWLAQDQRGFPQRICEAHAAGLALLLSEVRLTTADLLPAIEAARRAIAMPGGGIAGPMAREQIAATWISRVATGGQLARAGLIEDVARFLLEVLFHYIIEQPRLLTGLKPTLAEYRDGRHTGAVTLPAPTRTAAMAPVVGSPVVGSPVRPTVVSAVAPAATVSAGASAAVAAIGARHGLQDAALKRFQAILATQIMSGEQRLARLDELGAWLASTIVHLVRPTNDPPELKRLKTDAAAALSTGDLERAMDLLRDVRNQLRDDRRRSEARLAEEMETLKGSMIAEAEAASRLGELALARCEFEAAAELFAEAAGNLPTREIGLELEYRQRQAEALAAKAEMTGDARSLGAAAAAFRAASKLIDAKAEPAVWARVHVGLGDMLMALGTRSSEANGELEQAAVAYEQAIAVIDRAAHPMRWALVQLSRSVALIEIGTRSDREKHWLAAAAALMPALEVFEARGASDLAEAARAKLRMLAGALEPGPAGRMLTARSA